MHKLSLLKLFLLLREWNVTFYSLTPLFMSVSQLELYELLDRSQKRTHNSEIIQRKRFNTSILHNKTNFHQGKGAFYQYVILFSQVMTE